MGNADESSSEGLYDRQCYGAMFTARSYVQTTCNTAEDRLETKAGFAEWFGILVGNTGEVAEGNEFGWKNQESLLWNRVCTFSLWFQAQIS